MLMCTMAWPRKLSRWCNWDWGERILCNSWLFFQFDLCKSRQIITGIGIKDLDIQGFRQSRCSWWFSGNGGWAAGAWEDRERERRCYTITMYEWILRCSEAESFGLGVKAENLLENIILHQSQIKANADESYVHLLWPFDPWSRAVSLGSWILKSFLVWGQRMWDFSRL